jgi:carbonic anhydrase/acetyltransferase-like protein (isoleucine patch superfamily)
VIFAWLKSVPTSGVGVGVMVAVGAGVAVGARVGTGVCVGMSVAVAVGGRVGWGVAVGAPKTARQAAVDSRMITRVVYKIRCLIVFMNRLSF